MPTKAYSYIRFSSPEQLKGDSLRRQLELSKEYAKRNDLDLDGTLRMEDLGVSAFRGDNRLQGALGAFLKMVEDGKVNRGSYLLVESLDRISREKVSVALENFLSILNKGIVLVTLTDGMKYDIDTLDMNELIISITVMSRAHEESATKGKRIKASWDKKKKEISEKKLTKWSPKWLYLSDDKKEFLVHEDRAELVREIYDWCASGLGTSLIIQRIEERGIKPWDMGQEGMTGKRPAKKWYGSYIQRLLHDRSVLGEYRLRKSDPKEGYELIKGYYPRILSEELFYQVQRARDSRNVRKHGTGSGRKGKELSNIFSGIAYCGYSMDRRYGGYHCAGNHERMSLSNKGRNLTYLQCTRTKNGNTGCELCRKLWRYDAFEKSFLTHIRDIDVSVLFGTPSELRQEIEEVSQRLSAQEGRLVDAKKQITLLEQQMDEALRDGKRLPNFATSKTVELEELIEKLEPVIEALKAEIKSKEDRYNQSEKNRDELINIIDHMASLKGQKLFDMRMKLSELLRRTIERIEVFSNGFIRDEELIGDQRKFWVEEAANQLRNADKLVIPFYFVKYKSGKRRFIITNPKSPADIVDFATDPSGKLEHYSKIGGKVFEG